MPKREETRGRNMSAQTKRAPDYALLALVMALTVFGLVMVYSASFMIAVSEGHQQIYYLVRQFLWSLFGGALLLVGQRVDYNLWRKLSLPIIAVTVALLFLVLVLPKSMTSRGGAERWITFGAVGIQPTELAKFGLVVYLASWLMGRGPKLRSMTISLIPFAVIMGVILALVMLEPNLSTAIILGVTGIAVYFAAGANLLHIGGGLILGGSLAWVFMQGAAYRLERFKVFQNPWLYERDGGFQPIHAMYALASGGWYGRGLGQSRQKFNWLPSAHADAIFSVIGEELGLIGTLAVIVAFLLLAYRGYRIASRSRDPFAALVAVGITSWLTFQAFVNMAVVARVIPFTGVTLPFISYGGSSLAMCLFAVGVLLNISKHVDDQPPEPAPIIEKRPQAARRRQVAVFPGLAALMRRRNRGPRVSSASRSFSFSRKVEPSRGIARGGWRRLASGAVRKPPRKPAGRASSGRGSARGGTTASTGSWRRRASG
jgi:cell division protein FtsW